MELKINYVEYRLHLSISASTSAFGLHDLTTLNIGCTSA